MLRKVLENTHPDDADILEGLRKSRSSRICGDIGAAAGVFTEHPILKNMEYVTIPSSNDEQYIKSLYVRQQPWSSG